MNKHPHVYKTVAGSGILSVVCIAILFCSFAITANAGWKEPNLPFFATPPATITGKVTDGKNAPMEGVNVVIKGSKRGVVTNAAGIYTISNVPENATLVFSFTGFDGKEVAVKGTSPINVSLTEVVNGLNDVVVVGYGTTTRKDLTGSITQVKTAKMETENPRSVQDFLRGNVAGLDVGFDASTKGSNASLQIRGTSNFANGDGPFTNRTPLLVLNGVIYSGSLADINPNDVATIDVLKDASAAAIYGAQASNGVIIITTKKGKVGKPVITYNANIGMNKITRHPHLLNGDEFITWRQDALWSMANFDSTSKPGIQYKFTDPTKLPSSLTLTQWLALGGNTRESNATDPQAAWLARLNLNDGEIANYKAGNSINFDKIYYNQSALQHDHTISISQRKEDMNYYFSAGYLQNQGITNGEKPYQVFRTSLSLEANVAKYLTLSTMVNFSERNESGIVMNRDYVSRSSPWGSLYNADGTPTASVNNDIAVSNNPIFDQLLTDRAYKYDNVFAVFSLKGKLPYGFSYETRFRPTFGFTQEYNHKAVTPATGGFPTASRINQSNFNWLMDNILNWNQTYGKHSVGLQFIQSAEKNRSWRTEANASGFSPNDNLSYSNLQSGTQTPAVKSTDEVTTGASLLGRLTYDYNKRYYLTGTFRRDGYSGFGTNFPYANFYSVAAQWALSDESFMKGTNKWLDYAKIRVSYGEAGNRSIRDPLATLYTLGTGSYVYLNNGNPTNLAIIYANQLANPNLKWEKKGGYNLGIDYSILRGRVSGSIDLYNNKSNDLLTIRSLPNVSGFSSMWANLGSVQNKGINLNVSTMNMKRNNFEWTSDITFSLNRNTVLHIYGASPVLDATGKVVGSVEKSDTLNGWFIGHDISSIYDYEVIGVWQSSEAAQAKLFNQGPGDFKIKDQNGDGKITAQQDKVFQGSTAPKFTWSLRNDFKLFKNFDLGVTMYSSIGQKRGAGYRYNNDGFANRYNFFYRPYWTPSNPINDYARVSSYNASVGSGNNITSSFVRISNVSLGYTVPTNIVQKWGFQSLKVYVNVVNLALISGWDWWDAESTANIPVPMTYNFGFNVSLTFIKC